MAGGGIGPYDSTRQFLNTCFLFNCCWLYLWGTKNHLIFAGPPRTAKSPGVAQCEVPPGTLRLQGRRAAGRQPLGLLGTPWESPKFSLN